MSKKEEYYTLDKKTLVVGIIVCVIAVVLGGLYFTGYLDQYIGKNETKTAVQGPAPKFELIAIEPSGCPECMNVTQAVEIIKNAPTLNITSDKVLSFDSDEGKKLIEKYGIKHLPAFVLKGKNLNADLAPFEKKKDALVFGNAPPVYYDIATGEIVGKVTAVIITKPDCKNCFNVSLLIDQLAQYGMLIVGKQEVSYASKEGLALIKEYGIIKVPTLILSEDAIEYETINQSWKQIGSIEEDGKLVMRTVNAPYYDLIAKKTRGYVDIVYIKDKDCSQCYDPSEFKGYFEQNFGVVFDEVKNVDVSSSDGKNMVKKYNITLVPTAIFSGDIKEYPAIKEMWGQLGKVVNGTYVFTAVDKLQGIMYKDLSTGKTLGNATKMPEVVIN